MEKKGKSSYRKQYFELLQYGSVGLEMGIAVLIGVGIGWYVDMKVFDGLSSPWFTLFFLFCGIAAGARAFFRAAKELREKTMDKEDEPR